jgi:enamine deaminase RidA (YjgF/YER057c/UK114 family)
MSIERIEPNGRLSQAVTHGQAVYLTGQIGVDGQSIEEQTHSVLESIDRLLAASGTDKSRILQATVWLADRNDFEGMNAIWDRWVDRSNPPARSTGQMALLAPGLKVEITVVAAKS